MSLDSRFTTHDSRRKHYCGVFGVFGVEKAAELAYLGLFALQHRGEESAGIATSDGKRIYLHKAMGLVNDAIPVSMLQNLPGKAADRKSVV